MASAQANPNNNAQNHSNWPSYSHHTLLFNPTINKEVPEREQLSFANQSRRYLQKHRAGFIFVRWLRNDANKKDEVVGLFVTAKRPRELVAIKKITFFNREHLSADPNRPLPAEIEQSTLDISDNYNARSPQWRQRLLTNDVLYGQILAQVDVQVDGYIQKRKNAESVRWTQGQWQVMPYRSPISDPRARRWDFRAVRSYLSRVSRKQAQAYNGELTPPSLSFVRHNLVYNTNTRIRREESTPPEGYTQQPDPQPDPSDDLSTASITVRVPGRGQIQDMIKRRNELGKVHENEHNLTRQAEAGFQAAEASGADEAKLAELRLRLEACKANEAVAKANVEQMQWQIRLAEDAREFNDAMGARRDANAAATDAAPNERKAKREALARAENRARRRLEMWKDTQKRLDEVNEELKEAKAAHAEAQAQVLASTAQRTKSTKLIIKRGKSVQAKKVAASEYDPSLGNYDVDMTTPKKPPTTTQRQQEEWIVGGVKLPSYPFVDRSWLWERPVGTPSSPAPMPRGELIRYRLRQQWEQERREERRKKKEAARAAAAKGGRAGQ
ncbi:hypothetical protein VTJ04DRAFT_8350 [Mycothermus thermophilus]|uniref:uncharacterized protein n=1 Tax=Humicola insolens TaxID=85995 RepID=UPI0037442E1A